MNNITMDINDYLANKVDIISKSFSKPIDKLILTGIAPENLSELFYDEGYDDSINCKIIDVNNFDTSKVTSMNGMFYNCRNLKTLDVSNFDTSKVIGMRYMFNGCENLKTLDISNFDMKNVYLMDNMLWSCSYINTFKLPNDKRFEKQ